MRNPLVSVVMTVFNTRQYVKQAVESILSQSLSDLELVIVDDGSTDGSTGILRELARRDTRVRLVSRPNTGILRAANEGLSMARGEFLARMDSDDVSLRYRLEKQVEFLRSHPDVVALSGLYDYVDEKGRKLTTIRMPLDDEAIQLACLKGIPALCHGCLMVRTSVLQFIGGYDAAFTAATEDLDLFLRLGEVGRLANLPEVLLRVRLHAKSFGGANETLQHKMARCAAERAWKRRGIQGRFEGAMWRPTHDRLSRHRFMLRCGWWAFNSDERRTAMIYGAKAVAIRPFALAGWNLLGCACLKRQIGIQSIT